MKKIKSLKERIKEEEHKDLLQKARELRRVRGYFCQLDHARAAGECCSCTVDRIGQQCDECKRIERSWSSVFNKSDKKIKITHPRYYDEKEIQGISAGEEIYQWILRQLSWISGGLFVWAVLDPDPEKDGLQILIAGINLVWIRLALGLNRLKRIENQIKLNHKHKQS